MAANCAPLLADGGSMRIVSRMAAYTWGTYGNTWPEGFNAPEPPGDDRDLGFITKLPGRTPGKFGRMFVRADAHVDAVQKRSDVEDILDAASKRTSGEVYFEREIGPEGHGRMVPYVDFDINDFVPVRVWGRVLPDNLVVEINSVIEAGRVIGYNTHVGGQKWWDLEALRTENREVDKIIGAERRERGDELAAIKAEAREYARTEAELAAQAAGEDLRVYIDQQDELVDEAAKGYADDVDTAAQGYAEKAQANATTAAKGYADDVDTAAQGYANTAQSKATAAAGRYTDTTVKPVRDQSNAIDSDIASAIALVGGKYGVNVAGVAKNRRVTTALDSINAEVDSLNSKHTSLSNRFSTLSNNYSSLNNRLDDLNQDYDNALGTNGTLVNDQKSTNDKLNQIIRGEGAFVDGSNLVTMFAAWSAMQSVFNDEQVGINDGFQKLFAQQTLINAAQKDINDAQSEINDAQDEINRVQGEINRAQTKINKTLDYNQQYAEIVGDSRRPHLLSFDAVIDVDSLAVSDSHGHEIQPSRTVLGNPELYVTYTGPMPPDPLSREEFKEIVRVVFPKKYPFFAVGSYHVLVSYSNSGGSLVLEQNVPYISSSGSGRVLVPVYDASRRAHKSVPPSLEFRVEVPKRVWTESHLGRPTAIRVLFSGALFFTQMPGYYADALYALPKPTDN